MWSVLLYIVASLMCLYGLITLRTAWSYRFKHIGLDLGAICFLAGAIAAVNLEKWWPLILAFVLTWVIRLLGGDPGYFGHLNPTKVWRAGRTMRQIQQASSKVRVATFARLIKRYEPRYGSQAKPLACAITNMLFYDEFQEGTPAMALLQTQKGIIEKELQALKDDKDLLTMVHITLSEEIGVRYAHGSTAEQIEETFNNLKQYGLLVPVKGLKTNEFLNLANEFYLNSVSE